MMFVFGFNILLSYPAWFILLALALGLGYAAVLYYRNRADGFPRFMTWLLATLRFLSVFLLAMLLLGPLVERLIRSVEEPMLIFVQDNSQSVVDAAQPGFDPDAYLVQKNQFLERASSHFDVRTYHFGESFRIAEETTFDDRLTDMSEVFSGIQAYYSNRNIGAVILAGDGIFNRGMSPLNAVAGLPYPVYTLALGDTLPRRDLVVGRVRHNRMTYLGNLFPVEVFVEARQAAGMSSTVSVSRDGEVLVTKSISFTGDHHQQTLLFELEAENPGMQRYTVDLAPIDGEISLENNRQSFYIDVIDGRQRVLLLGNSAHPDIGALKMALEAQDNYEVSSLLINDYDGSAEAYNLVIMHQLPASGRLSRDLLQQVMEADIPVLFVIGRQTNLGALNTARTGLTITARSDDFVEALPAHNSSFALFAMPDQALQTIASLPPLHVPFAQFEQAGSLHVMFYQRIGQVTTGQPLIAFMQTTQRKTGFINGEGIWRWRLHTYLRDGTHQAFDDMISRMVQYLSVEEDRSLFRVTTDQLFYENESVTFEAELYNRAYELVNSPEVTLTITNEEGISFPYVMTRTSNAYQLDAGSFQPGEYTYVATTTLGAETFGAEGRFNVSELNLESLRTIADHNLLYQIADISGGELFFAGDWEAMLERITGRPDIRPVMYARRTLDELINSKAIFFLILLLLSLEWFARKRSGSY